MSVLGRDNEPQQTGPADEPISYPVALDLAINGASVTGTFFFRFDPVGKPLIDEALESQRAVGSRPLPATPYEGGDNDKLQFGTLLLEIGADGDTLIGNDVGYGYTTRQTLMAMTRLRRSAPA